MKLTHWIVSLLSFLILSGCQSTALVNSETQLIFDDNAFPDYKQVHIESEQDVFYIDDEVKAFVDKTLDSAEGSSDKVRALVAGILDHNGMDIVYVNGANTVASETFRSKRANCLSLTIMTYAMADYANMDVRFQEENIPEFWVRRDQYSFLNGHVNLRVSPGKVNRYQRTPFRFWSTLVDFERRARRTNGHFPTKEIGKNRVMAMFYNNRGADALVAQNYSKAYAYFRSALESEPEFGPALTNLGLTYRLAGHIDQAEATYLHALALKGTNTAAKENLAQLYAMTDRKEASERILSGVKRSREENPFYHYMLGQVEYDSGNWYAAINHYRAAILLEKEAPDFYFAMAKSFYQLGDINSTVDFLKKAKKHAKGETDMAQYDNKLNLLSSL